jgi:hypothetical protein
MKKVLAIALAMMLVPFTAFGLEMLEDSTLESVTGQAGVSINLDVHVDATIGTAAWGDADGLDGTNGGYVGMLGMTIEDLRVRAREDWALTGNAALIGQLEFLTIDVASDATYGGNTYVRINPGTFDITMASFDAEVALGDDTTLDERLGLVFMTNMLVRLDAGNYVDIYTNGGSGVGITMSVNIDTVSFATLGWGDTDGLVDTVAYGVPGALLPNYVDGAYTAAGYVGLANFDMTELTVAGTVTIDVVTLDVADPVAAGTWVPGLYATWLIMNPGGVSESYVHLAFSGMSIAIESMSGEVQVGSTAALAEGTLGNFYIGDVAATVNGWVDIFAH